jgi:hypothetical protein
MNKTYQAHIYDDLYLRSGDDTTRIISVLGNIQERNYADSFHIELPLCERVEGAVSLQASIKLNMPICKKVGGNVMTSGNAHINLPLCTHISGEIYADGNSHINLLSA